MSAPWNGGFADPGAAYTLRGMQESDQDRVFVRRVILASIHLAILCGWVVLCARFVAPFFFPVLWGAIIATAVWPLFRMGFRQRPKLGATAFVILALTVLLVPSWLAVDSIASFTLGV